MAYTLVRMILYTLSFLCGGGARCQRRQTALTSVPAPHLQITSYNRHHLPRIRRGSIGSVRQCLDPDPCNQERSSSDRGGAVEIFLTANGRIFPEATRGSILEWALPQLVRLSDRAAIRHAYKNVARAIGAAISELTGEHDKAVLYPQIPHTPMAAKQFAFAVAIYPVLLDLATAPLRALSARTR